MSLGIGIIAIFFLGMGLAGALRPSWVVGLFGMQAENPSSRNEVRSVYGGTGFAVFGLLIVANFYPELQKGIFVSIAALMLGMAAVRLLSALMEKTGKLALVFILIEIILGLSCLALLRQ